MSTPTLHTKRLRLRPVEPRADAAAFHRIYSHPQAMRFMPMLPHTSVEETHESLQWSLSQKGAHLWAIEDKAGGALIGQIDFLGATRFPGMGYILHPDYWGQGYAIEAGRAVLDFGFETLAYDRVELWIDETNIASRRVAEKLGFVVRGRFSHKYPHEPRHHFTLVYGLMASEWRGTPPDLDKVSLMRVEPVLPVRDVRAATAYYSDVLGFRVDFVYGNPPDYAGVSYSEWSAQGVTIQLSQVSSGQTITPSGQLYIFTTSGIDRLFASYKANGARIVAEPEDKPWGLREFFLHDLDGHLLRFGTNL